MRIRQGEGNCRLGRWRWWIGLATGYVAGPSNLNEKSWLTSAEDAGKDIKRNVNILMILPSYSTKFW